ncbi:unnamed protein product [Trichogramma brassicae]|uniref:CCHC-type domain-containing protein n=1 Tax=Trichogramma brassicae TaxID=86971 RepID=A0A6H5IM92_9HYME|nr:unnamed protein product [Trichogramma brassicae]
MSDPNEIDGITPDHLAVCEGMRRAWQRERSIAERDLLEISLDGDIEEPVTVDYAEATSQESQRDVGRADTSAEDSETEVVLTLKRPENEKHSAISRETPEGTDGAGKQPEGPIQQGNAVASELATLSLEAERQEEERLREEALRSRERKRRADAAEKRIAAARGQPTAGASDSTHDSEDQRDSQADEQEERYRRQGARPKVLGLRSNVETEESHHAHNEIDSNQRQANRVFERDAPVKQTFSAPPALDDRRSPRMRSVDETNLPNAERLRQMSLHIVGDRRWLPVTAQPPTGLQEWDLEIEPTPPPANSHPTMMAGPPPDLVNQGNLPVVTAGRRHWTAEDYETRYLQRPSSPELFGPSQLASRNQARVQHNSDRDSTKRPLPIKRRGVQFGNLTPIPTDEFLDPPPYTCFNCRGRGHGNRNCPDPPTQYCENCGRRGCSRGTCPRCKVAYQRWLAFSEQNETPASKKRTSPTRAEESPLPKRARSPTRGETSHESRTTAESQAEATNYDQLKMIAAILEGTRDLSPEELRRASYKRVELVMRHWKDNHSKKCHSDWGLKDFKSHELLKLFNPGLAFAEVEAMVKDYQHFKRTVPHICRKLLTSAWRAHGLAALPSIYVLLLLHHTDAHTLLYIIVESLYIEDNKNNFAQRTSPKHPRKQQGCCCRCCSRGARIYLYTTLLLLLLLRQYAWFIQVPETWKSMRNLCDLRGLFLCVSANLISVRIFYRTCRKHDLYVLHGLSSEFPMFVSVYSARNFKSRRGRAFLIEEGANFSRSRIRPPRYEPIEITNVKVNDERGTIISHVKFIVPPAV